MIVLDTCVWIWAVSEPARLSRTARRRIEDSSSLRVSAISVWEVGMLLARGCIRLDRRIEEWVELALSMPKVSLEPLTPAIALTSTKLPGPPATTDPADRMILATSLALGAPLLTPDDRLRSYPHADVVW